MDNIRDIFHFDPAEFDDLAHDPWGWRWPETVRSSLRRLIPTTARAVWEVLWDYYGRRNSYRLSVKYFTSSERRETDTDEEAVEAWLLQHAPDANQDVLLAYEQHDHVYVVGWDVFCQHWADFCSPGDELIISPFTEEWVLYYHHEEVIFWGWPSHKATGRRLPIWDIPD